MYVKILLRTKLRYSKKIKRIRTNYKKESIKWVQFQEKVNRKQTNKDTKERLD